MTERSTAAHPYAGQTVAFLTQHGKERVVSPVLNDALGCRVERVDGYDTDRLGTFTREIPRPGSQLDAARRKARIGMELHGSPLGLASEGSFGPDPHTGMFPWNVEVLLFIDDIRGIEVAGVHQGPASQDHARVGSWEELRAFAQRTGFPAQHLVIRPGSEDDPRLRKGLADWTSLEAAYAWALQADKEGGRIFVERDLRAHAHPERMERIGKAAQDLARKLASLCPACGCPGFARVQAVPGLPCGLCGHPTREHRAEILGCPGCGLRKEQPRADGAATADPARCDYCNP